MDSVYIIEGVDAVKVGVAREPLDRLAQLQTGNPDRLRLAWSMPIAGDAYAVETEAHAILDRHRIGGEWFEVPTEVAVAAVSGAAFRLGASTVEQNSMPTKRLSWSTRWWLAVVLPFTFWVIALGPAPTCGCVFLLLSCLALLWRARKVPEIRHSPLPTRAFFIFAVPTLFLVTAWPAAIIIGWLGYGLS